MLYFDTLSSGYPFLVLEGGFAVLVHLITAGWNLGDRGTNKFFLSDDHLSLGTHWSPRKTFMRPSMYYARTQSESPANLTLHCSSRNLVLYTFMHTEAIVTESKGSTTPVHWGFPRLSLMQSLVADINRSRNLRQA